MNQVHQLKCKYLSPNKTVETISISHQDIEIVVYLYNFKGQSFRVFNSKERLKGFWKGMNNEDFHFESEMDLDHWLHNVGIK
jgi:hypothetical protein